MTMSTSSGSADYGLFDELAEEFAGRYRRGERPSLQGWLGIILIAAGAVLIAVKR